MRLESQLGGWCAQCTEPFRCRSGRRTLAESVRHSQWKHICSEIRFPLAGSVTVRYSSRGYWNDSMPADAFVVVNGVTTSVGSVYRDLSIGADGAERPWTMSMRQIRSVRRTRRRRSAVA